MNMRLIKKLTALIIASVMAVSGLALSGSALDYFTINPGEKITYSFDDYTRLRFLIETEQSGELTIKFDYTSVYFSCVLANIVDDEDFSIVRPTSIDASEGTALLLDSEEGSGFNITNYDGGKCVCTVKYNVKKGCSLLTISNENIDKELQKGGNIGIDVSLSNKSISLNRLSVTLAKGDTLRLGALMSDGSAGNVKWTSSKKSVAAVNSKGKVRAKAKGKAVITAEYGDQKIKITVVVK